MKALWQLLKKMGNQILDWSILIFALIWLITKFQVFAVITSLLLFSYAIWIFLDSNISRYRSFLFEGTYFDEFFNYTKKCISISIASIAVLIIVATYQRSSQWINIMGIIFFGTICWIAARWLLEAKRIQKQGVTLTFVQKFAAWLSLLGSIAFLGVSVWAVFYPPREAFQPLAFNVALMRLGIAVSIGIIVFIVLRLLESWHKRMFIA